MEGSADCTGEHPGFDHIVEEYKYLVVQLNNKLDWTPNIHVLYKKGQSHLYLLRRRPSMCVVASAILCTVVSWGSSEKGRMRLNRLIRRTGFVLHYNMDSIEEMGGC